MLPAAMAGSFALVRLFGFAMASSLLGFWSPMFSTAGACKHGQSQELSNRRSEPANLRAPVISDRSSDARDRRPQAL